MKTIFSIILGFLCVNLSAQNHVFDSITANHIGIGNTYPQTQLEVTGHAKVSDSIVTPVIQNLNSIHVTSYREESTTNAGLYISGAQGKTTLLGNFYADHLTSKGQRQHKFIISSYASLANLNFGKNDTVTFVDYTWDTISFFAQTNRKDLGKPALPWRNLYAQNVYSNGTKLENSQWLNNGIHIYFNPSTQYSSNVGIGTSNPIAKFHVTGNAYIGTSEDGLAFTVANETAGYNSIRADHDWKRLYLMEGWPDGQVGINTTNPGATLGVNGTLNVIGRSIFGDTTVMKKIYLSPTNGGLEFVTNYNIGTKSVNYGYTPNFTFIRYNGTFAAKSKIVAGNLLLNIAARGYDGSVETLSRAAMQFYAPTDWSTTSHQSGIMLFTTDTIAQRERMRITEKGFVGIGTSAPTANLAVSGNSSPAILVTNTGGVGGAAFQMNDIAGTSNWYFKATTAGFKIRDNTNLMDVMTFEKNSLANALYIKAGGKIGSGTTNPTSNFHIVAPNSGAESLLKCEVSDAAGSYFDVGNGTSINGAFIPAFTGFNNTDGRSGFGLYGVHQDALFSSKLYPAISFGGYNTSWGVLTTTPIINFTNSNFEEFSTWYDGRTAIGAHNIVSGTGAVGSIRPSTMLDVKSITGNTSDLLNLIDNVTSRFYVKKGGQIGVGTTAPTTTLDINSNTIRLRTARTVVNSTDEGNAGDICWDTNYVYVCTATNTWRRSAISSW